MQNFLFGGFYWMKNKCLLLSTFSTFQTPFTLLTNCAMIKATKSPKSLYPPHWDQYTFNCSFEGVFVSFDVKVFLSACQDHSSPLITISGPHHDHNIWASSQPDEANAIKRLLGKRGKWKDLFVFIQISWRKLLSITLQNLIKMLKKIWTTHSNSLFVSTF